MKKMLLAATVLIMANHSMTPAYAFTDLHAGSTPPPNTKRGKFKRRTKGRK